MTRLNKMNLVGPMTAVERLKGRYMRAPEHPGGDNGGGNSDEGNGESPSGDNRGQDFDYDSFWDGDGGEESKSPSQEGSADKGTPSSAPPKESEKPQPTLLDQIQGLKIGDGLMSEKVIAELAEGKTDAFNAGIQDAFRQSTTQTVRLVVGLMQQLQNQLRGEIDSKVDGTFKSRDNLAELHREIPSSKDPAVFPMVKSIYDRALTLTKGDKKEAAKHTKEMMRLMGEKTAPDSGLRIAPKNAGDNGVPESQSNTNWLDVMVGRE